MSEERKLANPTTKRLTLRCLNQRGVGQPVFSFPLISARRLRRKKDASRGSFSTFGIATSCQTLDLTGWQILINNLTLYGNQPESTVMKMDARRALQMNTAV